MTEVTVEDLEKVEVVEEVDTLESADLAGLEDVDADVEEGDVIFEEEDPATAEQIDCITNCGRKAGIGKEYCGVCQGRREKQIAGAPQTYAK